RPPPFPLAPLGLPPRTTPGLGWATICNRPISSLVTSNGLDRKSRCLTFFIYEADFQSSLSGSCSRVAQQEDTNAPRSPDPRIAFSRVSSDASLVPLGLWNSTRTEHAP